MKTIQPSALRGFALLEVLIALLVGAIALLGLGTLQLKTLQAAYSSLDYTIATIDANNLVETLWSDLCTNKASAAVYTQTINSWKDTLPGSISATVPTTYADNATITLTWQDSRLTDNNTLALQAAFPGSICP